jgi:ribonuclease VapC
MRADPARQALDASALLAYLQGEAGHEVVGKALAHAAEGEPLLMSAVNWGEVAYILTKAVGTDETGRTLRTLATFPIDIVPADQKTAELAAAFKSAGKLAYADCFAAALAQLSGAQLLTADQDFESVKKEIHLQIIR